ncbi:hypothetical protein AKO1_007741 [Acrasis kona]|uniref:Uncharacterized protein n=1 Tax=Acrasis kona TaxID=1008807 RepID=A0AAW2YR18_9EUKA
MRSFRRILRSPYVLPVATVATAAALLASYIYNKEDEVIETTLEEKCTKEPSLREPIMPSLGIEITIHNWKHFRGQPESHKSLCDFFNNEMQRLGQRHFIATYLVDVLDGLYGDSLVGLHKTSSAVKNDDTEMIAEGFAKIVSTYVPLGHVSPQTKRQRLSDILQKINAERSASSHMFNETNFSQKVATIQGTEKFDVLIDLNTKSELSDMLVHLYISSNYNKQIALLITGLHSLDVLLPFLYHNSSQKLALGYFWRVVLNTYVLIGSPQLNFQETNVHHLNWGYIESRANSPVPSIIQALRHLEGSSEQSLYKYAALNCQ